MPKIWHCTNKTVADELHDLFKSLKTASTRSVKPTRDLAELLIFSTAAYEGFRKASISSPSGPPNIASIMNGPVYGPQWPPPSTVSKASTTPPEEDIEMVDHPGDKNMENGDDSSEATLVDMELPPSYNETQSKKDNQEVSRDDKDSLVQVPEVAKADSEGDAVVLNGANLSNELDKRLSATEKPPPIPPRNKSGLMIQTTETNTDDLWAFGSQQDVTEAIGNVLFRLQCAIKPTSLEENSGEQVDVIRDTFYGSNITYTQKAQSLEKKVEAWPSIIAFPDRKGPRDIYEAIDVVYDQQIVQIDKTTAPQFASIGKLPPILQIHIQRTDYDKDSGRATKNQKPVLFPETIYMDRYVDSDDMNSVLMRRRLETWRWKAQLRSLQTRLEALKTTKAEMDVAEALVATKEFVTALQEAEIDGIEVDPALPDALDERIGEVVAEIERISSEIAGLKQSLKDQFTDMREYEYKLQSVFIHRGEAGGGHYWVYIYDFANSIWREYNDEYVTEVKDRRRIFEHQEGAGGTPYYLVYVRSADEKDLVEAVCRDPQEAQMTDVTGTWAGEMEDEGIAMVDEEDDEVRHIEHAKPRPLRPKPAVQDKIDDWDAEWNNSDRAAVDANGRPWS
jgi:ubiquitin carboxyl-terminal hydrolase 25/28